MSKFARFICSSVLLFGFQSTIVGADTIEALYPQHYRNTAGVNRFGPGDDSLFIGVEVTPNPRTDPGIGDSTIVTASQNGITLTLQQTTSVFNPEFYFTTTPYDENLTGNWDIQAENADPGITNSPVNLSTPTVGGAQPVAFVEGMSLSGSLTDGFTISWVPPPVSDSTQIDISLMDGDINPIIHSAFLQGGVTSYVIPDPLLSGLSIEEGNTYMVSVINHEDRTDGTILAATSSYFEFSPTTESINAFLPTVDEAGVYNFKVPINTANEFVAIDPFVAIGYDFAIGEGDPKFAAAMLPPVGDNIFELWLYDPSGVPYPVDDTIGAGDVIDFQNLVDQGGVDKFRILGIETGALLDPTDPTAFVTDVSFVASGQFTGTMTPITEFVEAVVAPVVVVKGFECEGFVPNPETDDGYPPVAELFTTQTQGVAVRDKVGKISCHFDHDVGLPHASIAKDFPCIVPHPVTGELLTADSSRMSATPGGKALLECKFGPSKGKPQPPQH